MHLKVASWPSVTVTFIIVFWIWGGPQVFTGQFGNHDDDDDDSNVNDVPCAVIIISNVITSWCESASICIYWVLSHHTKVILQRLQPTFFGVARGLTNAWWHVHKKIRKHNLERVLFWKLGCCTVWQLLVSLVAINGSLPHSSRFQHQHNIDTLPAVLITTRSCNILHFVQLKSHIRMTSLNYALPRCQIFIALSPWYCRKVLLSFWTLINWPP